MRILTALLLALTLAACGSDSSGPKLDLTGDWRLTETLGWSNVTCSTSMDVSVTHTGTSITGVQVGTGSLSCFGPGGSLNEPIRGETLVGTLTRGALTFRYGSTGFDWTHEGTANQNSWSGTSQWDLGGDLFNGSFTAVRR